MGTQHYIKHRVFSELAARERDRRPSLYESKVRRRLLRVLLDEGALTVETDSESREVLRGLLRHPLVNVWNYKFVDTDSNKNIRNKERLKGGTLYVYEVTGQQGPFEFPGLNFSYSYSETDDEAEVNQHGWFNVDPPEVTFARQEIAFPSSDAKSELKGVQILSQAADTLGADLVLTDRNLDFGFPLDELGISQLVTPDSAIAAVAHYLRTQGEFVTGVSPRQTTTGEFYYRQALLAYCPNLEHWKWKVMRVAEMAPEPPADHILYTRAVISRFERGLRRFDDLVASIGQPPTLLSVDDAVDTVDHILVSLCGGVDALARSLGTALSVKNLRNSKLHREGWGNGTLKPVYGHAPEFDKLLKLLPALKFVFDMRNSIHEVPLIPSFDGRVTSANALGRIQLVIPPSYRNNWEKLSEEESEAWRLRVDGNLVQVDLLHFAVKALESVFAYVDTLCEIISFEQVGDENGVLFENNSLVFSEEGLEMLTFIATVGYLRSPLLDGSYRPQDKRHLEGDLEDPLLRSAAEWIRNARAARSGEFDFMDPEGIVTIYGNE